jgi:hypothetical protein
MDAATRLARIGGFFLGHFVVIKCVINGYKLQEVVLKNKLYEFPNFIIQSLLNYKNR